MRDEPSKVGRAMLFRPTFLGQKHRNAGHEQDVSGLRII